MKKSLTSCNDASRSVYANPVITQRTTKQPGSGADAAEVASSILRVLIVKVVVVVVSDVVVCGVVSGIHTAKQCNELVLMRITFREYSLI